MRKLFTLCLLSLVGLLGSRVAWADHLSANLTLSARLTTAQEVPAVAATAAQGTASFILNATRDTMFINATFSGLSGPITEAHIHKGDPGVAGGVITPLTMMVRGNQLRGYITNADISQARIADYLNGNNYINVHTAANPNGEIRGQIYLQTDNEFFAAPTSTQEVPAPPSPNVNAGGFGIFSLGQSGATIKFRVVLYGLSGPVTQVYFHNAVRGVAGPAIIDLKPYLSGNVVEGELPVTAALFNALINNSVYFNVYTDANPDGEIRGQMFYSGFVDHDARADAAQMVPATTSTGKGVVLAQLYPTLDTLDIYFSSTGLSGPVTSVSLYAANAGEADVPGNSGNLLVTVGPPDGQTSIDLAGIEFTAADGINAAFVNAALTGNLNVTFNTAAFPNGEIRGQIYRLAREGYTFSLNGAQERPTPTPSEGYGSGFVSIDRDQTNAFYGLTWGGLTGPAQMGHFHTGLSNEAGPVIHTIFGSPIANSYAYGYWTDTNPAPNDVNPFTVRRSMQFQKDSMYVNLHTAQYPNGEIRGQVYRGARNLQKVLPTQPAALVTETFSTYPSPFQSALTLTFDARRAGSGRVLVADMLGRTVLTQAIQVRTGANTQQLALPNAASGAYLVTVEVDDAKLVSRVFKQ